MNRGTIKNAFGLGSKAALLLATLAGQEKHIFNTQEAHDILGTSRSATYKLLHDLVQKGWLQSLSKGKYLIIPLAAGPERQYTVHEFLIAHYLAPEGYIAYWTALHHHGLTEQVPRTVWVATPKQRKTTIVCGVTYEFVTLRPYKFFGQASEWIEGEAVPIADLEKSLIDGLDHPEYCGGIGEMAKALHTAWIEREVDLERLTEYGRQLRNRAIFKRLGYVIELLSLPAEGFAETWQGALSKGYALLDPTRPEGGPLDGRWKVQVNAAKAELVGWMEG